MTDFVAQLFSLEGKTAIVTGASRGIGAGIAIAFKRAGANLVCLARSQEASDPCLADNYRSCDITDPGEFKVVCQEASSEYGSIEILVNAAGVTYPMADGEISSEKLQTTLATNLVGAYQCCELVSTYMVHGGSIINVTSIGSIQAFPGNPSYAASKGGLRMLSKSLALDLSDNSIRVNNLVPGYIETDMTRQNRQDPAEHKKRLRRMIAPRWGLVDDLVGGAIFLASDASSYVTGVDLVVDGGWLAKGL
jgi:NAD(P)-dependent dehydrogenase (short-subunit alcohol dehydrogenase family)